MISFSKAVSSKDYDQWVHFYEDDCRFERLWRNPQQYLEILRRFQGVILPDFSLYRDMPFVMQLWNIYRSRAIGCWLQRNGVRVIVNIRFGDRRTYRFCCDGIEQHCTISVGTHGSMKNREDREILCEGVDYVIRRLKPSSVIFYGPVPKEVQCLCAEMGIKASRFDTEFAVSHQEVI